MRQIFAREWSLVSGAITALNCLVIHAAKSYEPPSVWSGDLSTPPTSPVFDVLYQAEIFLCLLATAAAIGGMFIREPATYTRITLALALFVGAMGNVALTMHA
jgi:hypothetical protein